MGIPWHPVSWPSPDLLVPRLKTPGSERPRTTARESPCDCMVWFLASAEAQLGVTVLLEKKDIWGDGCMGYIWFIIGFAIIIILIKYWMFYGMYILMMIMMDNPMKITFRGLLVKLGLYYAIFIDIHTWNGISPYIPNQGTDMDLLWF
jgi:hypothetical protein